MNSDYAIKIECPKCGNKVDKNIKDYGRQIIISCMQCGYNYTKIPDYDFYDKHPEVMIGSVSLDFDEYEDGELITNQTIYKDNTGKYHDSDERRDSFRHELISKFSKYIDEQVDLYLESSDYAIFFKQHLESYIVIPYDIIVYNNIANFSDTQLRQINDELFMIESASFDSKKDCMQSLFNKAKGQIIAYNKRSDIYNVDAVLPIAILTGSSSSAEYTVRHFAKYAFSAAEIRRNTGRRFLSARYAMESMKACVKQTKALKELLNGTTMRSQTLNELLSVSYKNANYAAGFVNDYNNISFMLNDLKTV